VRKLCTHDLSSAFEKSNISTMYIVLQDISTVADANQSYGIHIIDYS